MKRPLPPDYTSYHAQYIESTPPGDIFHILESQLEELTRVLGGLSEAVAGSRYAPGKWSMKEVLGHIIDTERIFTTRCLSFARSEPQSLPGFDQDVYVATGAFDERTLTSLLEELRAVRGSSLSLFRSLTEEQADRRGIANGVRLAARAYPWLTAGHAGHHLMVLRQRYL